MNQEPNKENFYSDGAKYWETVTPTINGMLGGFPELDELDVRDSSILLKEIQVKLPDIKLNKVLDCGAGIGRVTKHLLVNFFENVDLVEQNLTFLEAAKVELKDSSQYGKVKDFYNFGLHEFSFVKNYDVIWCQWVLSHLKDDDLINFLIKCKKSLDKNGAIIIKENISKNGYVLDEEDSSFTRSNEIFKKIFQRAGLNLVIEKDQIGFPQGMFGVKMYVLLPIEVDNSST